MSVEGSLDLFQLHEILQTVAHQQRTGILTVQGQDDIVAISFLKGKVVAADSLNQTGDEGLQKVLVREGLVEEGPLREAVALSESRGTRLQDVLVEQGLVERAGLLSALRLQYQELMAELLHWRQGEFKFYANDEVAFEDGLQPIVIQDLLLRYYEPDEPEPEAPAPPPGAVAVTAEEGDVPRDAVLERISVNKPIKVRAAGGEGGSDDEGFIVLSPLEQQILGRINGSRSIADLAVDCGLEAQWVQGAVDHLQRLGLVRPRSGPAADDLVVAEEPELPGPAASPVATGSGEVDLLLVDEALADEAPAEPRSGRKRKIPFVGGTPGRAPGAQAEGVVAWGARVLAVVVAALLAVQLFQQPQQALLPFPWLQEQRLGFIAQQRQAAHLTIDGAAKTYFLMNGRFPEQLDTLVEGGLLPRELVNDPQGYPLHYQPGAVQYQLLPLDSGETLMELSTTEAITDNFLLDLDFFSIPGSSLQKPLVLLD
ncbi:MAG: DUF4388 domain-containing protein [Acidobacteriota bacterium]|nr:DUF4388 domain-containing protein [Acidobacteriota bacterium]